MSDLYRQVRERAENRCEYCRLPQAAFPIPFHVDHVVSRKHGGPTTADIRVLQINRDEAIVLRQSMNEEGLF